MKIPKHFEIRPQDLKLLSTVESLKLKELEVRLVEVFQLTEEEVNRIYDSGNGNFFYDRISWAMS
jgi:restriction system protein